MGLFDLFSRKKRTVQEGMEPQGIAKEAEAASFAEKRGKDSKRPVRLNSHTERMGYIKENCEMILESDRQISEAKVEYQAVTSYLTDIQKITMLLPELRENLEEAARKIINLSKERNKLQRKSSLLSDRQYQLYEGFETQIPKDLKTLRESEEYQSAIQQDILHLERERAGGDYQQTIFFERNRDYNQCNHNNSLPCVCPVVKPFQGQLQRTLSNDGADGNGIGFLYLYGSKKEFRKRPSGTDETEPADYADEQGENQIRE